jgi:hypothetical protein
MKRLALIIVALIIGCDPAPELQVKRCVDACERAGMYVNSFMVGSNCMCTSRGTSTHEMQNLDIRVQKLERLMQDGGAR